MNLKPWISGDPRRKKLSSQVRHSGREQIQHSSTFYCAYPLDSIYATYVHQEGHLLDSHNNSNVSMFHIRASCGPVKMICKINHQSVLHVKMPKAVFKRHAKKHVSRIPCLFYWWLMINDKLLICFHKNSS